jgi:hypothetical protein
MLGGGGSVRRSVGGGSSASAAPMKRAIAEAPTAHSSAKAEAV